ncbi:Cytochrome b5-like heme/steroid binding domain [Trinorchestia longiramus]|nr:Cytochrome b5-like heme/steroid binding domain [Trinorchestia longiramus]
MESGREKDATPDPELEESFLQEIIMEAVSSPLNIVLLAVCCVLIYKIYRASRTPQPEVVPSKPSIPKMKKQDMTLKQLRQYDGHGEHNRVCVAVNGKIFDMTRSSHFYGPGGVYSAFAGHDATHALASFNIDDIKNESNDLSDLTPAQMDSVREWEMQFTGGQFVNSVREW